MRNGKTAERVWIEFLLKEQRIPTREEFEMFGYKKTTYYKMKKDLPNDYMLAQEWVKQHWCINEVYSDSYKTIEIKTLEEI